MRTVIAAAALLIPHLAAAAVADAPHVGRDRIPVARIASGGDTVPDETQRPRDPRIELRERPGEHERERDESDGQWMREQHDRAREWVREHPYR